MVLLVMAWPIDAWLLGHDASMTSSEGGTTSGGPPSLQAIRAKADLIVLEVERSCEVSASLQGKTGGVKATVHAVGQLRLGPDLSRARVVSMDHEHRVVKMMLPAVRCLDVSLDAEKTRVVSVTRFGLWQGLPFSVREDDVIERAMRSAPKQLEAQAINPMLMTLAKQHTQAVLDDLFHSAGWQVQVVWEAP